MARGEVDLVVTGADRIAANGDTANKIGTYALAVLARAPRHAVLRGGADLDRSTRRSPSGAAIPIEERARRRGRACRARDRPRPRRCSTPPSTSRRPR